MCTLAISDESGHAQPVRTGKTVRDEPELVFSQETFPFGLDSGSAVKRVLPGGTMKVSGWRNSPRLAHGPALPGEGRAGPPRRAGREASGHSGRAAFSRAAVSWVKGQDQIVENV